MACTTILVGRKASNDGSTMIARNDDGRYDEKKLVIINPEDQPKVYQSKIAHLSIELPENPVRYSATPNVNPKKGMWPANGINAYNVAMTATETITSNARTLGADPYVEYDAENKKPGGIGEEDLVAIVLPYIRTAREGVIRMGELLEKYGTYEPNGIAFSDENEIWWLETLGGHHWIAKRVKDEEYVIMPNQLGIDFFDLEDAFGPKKEHMCSGDLKEFIAGNHLDCNQNGVINPRWIFGSHDDSDHVYNTPRAWFMARYFNPRSYRYDGPGADFTPESDDIPWSLVPEHKITVEEVKYILSSYYQGTPFNPYSKADHPRKGAYRPIGINRTSVMAVLQIRNNVPTEIKAVEWLCLGPNPFNTIIPLFTNVKSMPKYVSGTKLKVDSNNFYWASRILAALADPHFGTCVMYIERYQKGVPAKCRAVLNHYDEAFAKTHDLSLLTKFNNEICKLAKEETEKTLGQVLLDATTHMKCGYSRSDN